MPGGGIPDTYSWLETNFIEWKAGPVADKTSLDIIRYELGTDLYPRGWVARSVDEMDPSNPIYKIPKITAAQRRRISDALIENQEKTLNEHVDLDSTSVFFADRAFFEQIHLAPSDIRKQAHPARLSEEDQLARFTVDSVHRKEERELRRLLVFSKSVCTSDPGYNMIIDDKIVRTLDPWPSTFLRLGFIHRLVDGGALRLFPFTTFRSIAFDHVGRIHPEVQKRFREQKSALSDLYKNAGIVDFIQQAERLIDVDEGFLSAFSFALGQFALRNIYCSGASPWLPRPSCAQALLALENRFDSQLLGDHDFTATSLSTLHGINTHRLSDEDILSIRSNDELFHLWQTIVSEVVARSAELESNNHREMRRIVKAQQQLWKARVDELTRTRSIISAALDPNSLVCGSITGAVALGSGVSPGLAMAAGLGGGLATPILTILSNLAGSRQNRTLRNAVSSHFIALSG